MIDDVISWRRDTIVLATLVDADSVYRTVLATHSLYPDVNHNMGMLMLQAGKYVVACHI